MSLGTKMLASFGRFDVKDPSFLTNLLSAVLVVLGYLLPGQPKWLQSMGWFALSGAVTNWLAIYMLFERVPGLYGSGIIPLKFEEFKRGIRQMIMQQFFTQENISRFLGSQGALKFEAEVLVEAVDFNLLFDKLLSAVQSSSFGPMLAMFGGVDSLRTSLRQPFELKMREALVELAGSPQFLQVVQKLVAKDFTGDHWSSKIDQVVQARLDELTPEMVKDIIQAMIRSHLGWLVVWGGVFGAVMGLMAALAETYA